MTDARPTPGRTVTVRSPSGRPVVRIGLLPGALAGLIGLAFFPRLTALAILAAWLRRVSLSIDG
jgi:hypothetical protein